MLAGSPHSGRSATCGPGKIFYNKTSFRPVTKRDGCIEGAKDDQVLPNPLEDASPPDLEKVEKVATPFPKVNLMGETKTANHQKFKMLGQTK